MERIAYLEVIAPVSCDHGCLLHLHPIYHVQEVNVRVLLAHFTVTMCPLNTVVLLHINTLHLCIIPTHLLCLMHNHTHLEAIVSACLWHFTDLEKIVHHLVSAFQKLIGKEFTDRKKT